MHDHDLWLSTCTLLQLETTSNDIFEWDLDVCAFLLEYLAEIESSIEDLKVDRHRFGAATSNLTDEQWMKNFRFQRADVERLRLALGIPNMVEGPGRR